MAFGLLCFFKALAGGEAAVVVPLTALYPLVTVILCRVVLQETITPDSAREWPWPWQPCGSWPNRDRQADYFTIIKQ